MSRSAVALLIVLTAIFGYFSMVGVAILTRGAPENQFEPPNGSPVAPVNPETDQVEPSEDAEANP
ncbi:MAG: hypothetical protein ACIALR_00975 [Blastopirellula sp. JB062]